MREAPRCPTGALVLPDEPGQFELVEVPRRRIRILGTLGCRGILEVGRSGPNSDDGGGGGLLVEGARFRPGPGAGPREALRVDWFVSAGTLEIVGNGSVSKYSPPPISLTAAGVLGSLSSCSESGLTARLSPTVAAVLCTSVSTQSWPDTVGARFLLPGCSCDGGWRRP